MDTTQPPSTPMYTGTQPTRSSGPSIGGAFSEGWRLVKGSKATYFGGIFLFILVMVGIAVVGLILTAMLGKQSIAAGLAAQVLQWVTTTVLSAGLLWLAVKRARGDSISAAMLFEAAPRWVPLAVASVIMCILIGVGFLLLVLPGIYLLVSYSFASPLIVDRGLGAWDALETSRKAVTKHWFTMFGWMILAAVLMAVTGVFLVPLIWTIPWLYNSYGVMYREMMRPSS